MTKTKKKMMICVFSPTLSSRSVVSLLLQLNSLSLQLRALSRRYSPRVLARGRRRCRLCSHGGRIFGRLERFSLLLILICPCLRLRIRETGAGLARTNWSFVCAFARRNAGRNRRTSERSERLSSSSSNPSSSCRRRCCRLFLTMTFFVFYLYHVNMLCAHLKCRPNVTLRYG